MMLSELLKALSEQAVRANGVQTVVPPVGHRLDYGVLLPDGSFSWVDVDPDPRQHKVSDVTSLVAFAEQMNAAKDEDAGVCVLWYARSGAVLIVDDKTRRDRVTLPLELSPQLKRLAKLSEQGQGELTQESFLRLLRVELYECWRKHPSLAANASKLRFRATEEGHSEIVPGKTSKGKALTLEKNGAETFPDVLTFTVPVFFGYPWSVDVVCDLQFTPDEKPFHLSPVAGAIETAIRLGESHLARDITAEMTERSLDIPLYYGTP